MDILLLWITRWILGERSHTRSKHTASASPVGVSVSFRERVNIRNAVAQTVTPSMLHSMSLGASVTAAQAAFASCSQSVAVKANPALDRVNQHL